MPEEKQIEVVEWQTDSDAYKLLAKFLVKKFVVKKEEGK